MTKLDNKSLKALSFILDKGIVRGSQIQRHMNEPSTVEVMHILRPLIGNHFVMASNYCIDASDFPLANFTVRPSALPHVMQTLEQVIFIED